MVEFPDLDFRRAALSLEGRTAIVTGASRGLGEAIGAGREDGMLTRVPLP